MADGSAADLLYCDHGGKIVMHGQEVFRRAVIAMENAANTAMEKAGVKSDDISLVVPHQANVRIIDAAMNDLLRPSLYDAKHKIRPILEKTNSKLESFDVVGPICESGDVLAKDITLPEEISDELLAIYSAGAYGSVMSSNYNSRLMIPEVLVKDQQFSVIRKRQTYDELLSNEKFADWQTI